MELQDLDRIRFVTRRFSDLQGLRRLVPAGLILLSGAGLTSFTSWPLLFLRALSFGGACLLLLGARRYYRSTFGEAEPPQAEPVAELSCVLLMETRTAGQLQPVIPVVPSF